MPERIPILISQEDAVVINLGFLQCRSFLSPVDYSNRQVTGRLYDLRVPPNSLFISQKGDKSKNPNDLVPGSEEYIEAMLCLQNIPRAIVDAAESYNHKDHAAPYRVLGRSFSLSQVQLIFRLCQFFKWYFFFYGLHEERWSCRRAWRYLLRLCYHSLVILMEAAADDTTLYAKYAGHFDLAWRDWRDFCLNEDNHYLFPPPKEVSFRELVKQATGRAVNHGDSSPPEEKDLFHLRCVDEEVAAMVEKPRAEGKGWRLPEFWRPFRTQPAERPTSDTPPPKDTRPDLPDLLIGTWLLPRRYHWLRAFWWAVGLSWVRLKARCGGWHWLVILLLLLTAGSILTAMAVGAVLCLRLAGIPPGLVAVCLLALPLALAGFISRVWLDLLLPRLWASIGVGYLALMFCGDAWKAANRFGKSDWQVWVGLWAAALLFSFFYLQWEIANRMRRTRGLGRWIPWQRGLVLTVLATLASLWLGAILLGTVGVPLWHVIGDSKPAQWYWREAFGALPLNILAVFAPVALLLGVVLQTFWEDKSIAHPLE